MLHVVNCCTQGAMADITRLKIRTVVPDNSILRFSTTTQTNLSASRSNVLSAKLYYSVKSVGNTVLLGLMHI